MNTGSKQTRATSDSIDETIAIGQHIGRALRGGDVVFLDGDLGAGKTTLTKGIALGLGHPEVRNVTSPTFVLVQSYACADGLVLNHVDAYRLEDGYDLVEIGGDDLLGPGSVTVIEWPERIEGLVTAPWLTIRLANAPTGPPDRRTFDLEVHKEHSENDLSRIEQLFEALSEDSPR